MARSRLVMGDEIAGYRLGEILGIGGLGTVYATERAGHGPLAIKLISHGGDHGLQVRASREVEALRRISHPNVLPLIDAGADDTWSYLVMPRITGTSLRELVANGPLLPESAALLVMHAARGVGAIHAGGLCHRDLKPDNIMITDDGRVLIIDLGLALAPDWTRQTTEGAIAGSLPYMAPEQIEGAAGAASDVWALAVTWWELVIGTRPFARTRPVEEIAAIAAGARPAIAELDRRLDPACAQLIERCLAREVTQRPANGDAMATAVRPFVADDPDALRALRADRAGWEARLAERVASTCARQADELASAGDVFAAMRAIDRGLAYRPDEPVLTSLLARIMPPNTASAVATPAQPVAVPRRRRRWPWLAGGLALATATTVGVLATRGGNTAPSYDFENPKAVVQAVIDAAQTGDTSVLRTLCIGETERRALALCEVRPEIWTQVRPLFQGAVIEGAYRTTDGATITIRYASQRRDTIELLRRRGRFYLRDL
ncbi:MAG: serine/threonine-protein kinase [Kofleriaceae bacterium]